MLKATGYSNLILVNNGNVTNLSGPPDSEALLNAYKNKAVNAGFEVETVGTEDIDVQVGDTIDNWSEFTIIET